MVEARLSQAFLKGYQDSAAVLEGFGPHTLPYASIVRAAELENQQMQRAIDACQDALRQMDELPEEERICLREEVNAALKPLLADSEKLLAHLRNFTTAPSVPVEEANPSGPARILRRNKKKTKTKKENRRR